MADVEIDAETMREACERFTILLIGQKDYDNYVKERGAEWTTRLVMGNEPTLRRAFQVMADMGISFDA